MPGPNAIIQYRNTAGAVVTVHDQGRPANDRMPDNHYTARCSGCMENLGTEQLNTTLIDTREWAADHAGKCAALPQFVTGADVDRAKFGALAEQYAQRAARLLEGRAPADHSTATVDAQDNPLDAARTYAALADVCARLAGH